MRTRLSFIAPLIFVFSFSAIQRETFGAEPAGIPADVAPFVSSPSETINIWSELPPGGIPEEIQPEEWKDVGDKYHSVFIFNVSIPTLAFYPADKPNGACVLVFPGGGYSSLAYNYEGVDIAKRFNQMGVSACVLKYRIPSRSGQPRYWAALQDARRAIRVVRSRAKEWKIDPNKVGVLGFSAGGHLAIAMANESTTVAYEPTDEIDKIDPKPNFAVPIYPGYLIEDANEIDELKLSEAIHIDPTAPPHFIAVASDDANRGFASAIFYCELKKQGVPAELHIPLEGGHGFGIREDKVPANKWIDQCEDWLRVIKMIP